MLSTPFFKNTLLGAVLITKLTKMENFFYDWKYYSDLDELIDSILDYSEEVSDLPDDWEIECMGSKLEPICQLSANWITERIDDDRLSENNVDSEIDEIEKALNVNIDFEKINFENNGLTYYYIHQSLY